jgi:Uma2 family endonuclease
MKAVIPSVPEHLLQWRKRTGADRYDEMWEGALHMPPAPNLDHEDLLWALETYLRLRWARGAKARVGRVNVALPGGWPQDYRVPDLILWATERERQNRNVYFEGPPDVVVEIRSPDDESYEKLPFYATLGVPEVWVVHRDTKTPEIYVIKGSQYVLKARDGDGWVWSDFAGVSMRPTAESKLSIRLRDGAAEELP